MSVFIISYCYILVQSCKMLYLTFSSVTGFPLWLSITISSVLGTTYTVLVNNFMLIIFSRSKQTGHWSCTSPKQF